MSKSVGNVIAPEQIIKQFGADVLRLWAASVEFNEDVRMSDTILERLSEAYRKLRNTFRYMLGNLHGFDPAKDAVPGAELLEIDQWILLRAEDLVARCLALLRRVFVPQGLSRGVRFRDRRSELRVLRRAERSSLHFCATLHSTAQRADCSVPFGSRAGAVAGSDPQLHHRRSLAAVWAKQERCTHSFCRKPTELTGGIPATARARAENWTRLMDVRTEVLKALEAARRDKIIGAPLEARLRLSADHELHPLLTDYAAELPGLFIVSQVALQNGAGALGVAVERAAGAKCERCWKYTEDVGSDAAFPTICAACAAAVHEIMHG